MVKVEIIDRLMYVVTVKIVFFLNKIHNNFFKFMLKTMCLKSEAPVFTQTFNFIMPMFLSTFEKQFFFQCQNPYTKSIPNFL